MRSYRTIDGRADVRHLGYSEDYAFVLEACLALYETTHDRHWLDEARWCADESIKLFLDEIKGCFFTTGTDAEELVTRSKDLIDNAVPAANSVFALELQRLALITSDDTYEHLALGVIRVVRDAMARSPGAFGHLLSAVDLYLGDPLEIVIVGGTTAADTGALLEVVRATFLPHRVLLVSPSGTEDQPLLRDRPAAGGRATAYVCRRGICKTPVTEPSDLAAELAG
jgi:uncharacterized protein YyaL (SSP411 family)